MTIVDLPMIKFDFEMDYKKGHPPARITERIYLIFTNINITFTDVSDMVCISGKLFYHSQTMTQRSEFRNNQNQGGLQ